MTPTPIEQAYVQAIQHHQAGRLREAESLYRQILAQQPDHADTLQMLGVLANDHGDAATAISLIKRAIALNPHAPPYYGNLGMVLAGQGKFTEAIAAYHQALVLEPRYPEAQHNLGLALLSTCDLDGAIEHFRAAIKLRPDYDEAYFGVGNASWMAGQYEEAMANYQRALALRPCSKAWHYILYARHFDPQYDAARLLAEHRRWASVCADGLAPTDARYENSPDPHRRLRIGYASPDFVEHPVPRFLLPLLENRDRAQFEIFAYSDAQRHDVVTQRLQSNVDVWRETAAFSDEQLAGQIRNDRIDILFDLALHTGARLPMFARKPAPVQVCYLGYCSTTGLKTMDYRLTDRYLDPDETEDQNYSERSIRLPCGYWCYESFDASPAVGPLPADKNGYVTFGCLNHSRKVNRATLSLWRRVLNETPGSKLIIHSYQGPHRQRVREFFAQEGIDAGRIAFVGGQSFERYFNQYNRIDIALDPFPYGGGTTTCDALWMGAPVVSLKGNTAVSRAGFSILSAMGIPQLVASRPDQYVQIASVLARDLSRLRDYRLSLRQRMQSSPLMDSKGFVRIFEAALRQMWRSWCESGRKADPVR